MKENGEKGVFSEPYIDIERKIRADAFRDLFQPTEPEVMEFLNRKCIGFTITVGVDTVLRCLPILIGDNNNGVTVNEKTVAALSEADRHMIRECYDNYISALANETFGSIFHSGSSVVDVIGRYLYDNRSEIFEDTIRINLTLLYCYIWSYFGNISINDLKMNDIYNYVNINKELMNRGLLNDILYLLRNALIHASIDTFDRLMDGAHAVHDYDLERDSLYKLPCGIDKHS